MSVAAPAPAKTRIERAQLQSFGLQGGVDRENNVIRGVVLAELGPFQTPGRGQFNQDSFNRILALAKELPAVGLKSRFTHPNFSNDGLGKHLGRILNIRQREKKLKGDLYLDPTSLKPPPLGGGTPLGEYVMDLAESDPTAFETSFVVSVDQVLILDENGERELDKDGNELPPIWLPFELHASDVVDDGDAVRGGFLSTRNTSEWARHVSEFLDSKFPNLGRDELEGKFQEFQEKYLTHKFGAKPMENKTPTELPVAELKEGPDIAELIKQAVAEQLAGPLAAINTLNDKLAAADKKQAQLDRVEKIMALCSDAKCPGKAAALIADETLSVADVREQLWEDMKKNRKLSSDVTELPGGDGGAGGGVKTNEAKLKAMYDEGKQVYERFGLSFEDFNSDTMLEVDNERELLAKDIALKPGQMYHVLADGGPAANN